MVEQEHTLMRLAEVIRGMDADPNRRLGLLFDVPEYAINIVCEAAKDSGCLPTVWRQRDGSVNIELRRVRPCDVLR